MSTPRSSETLCPGVLGSVAELEAAIRTFVDAYNADPKPFVWTKTADRTLASIARFSRRAG